MQKHYMQVWNSHMYLMDRRGEVEEKCSNSMDNQDGELEVPPYNLWDKEIEGFGHFQSDNSVHQHRYRNPLSMCNSFHRLRP